MLSLFTVIFKFFKGNEIKTAKSNWVNLGFGLMKPKYLLTTYLKTGVRLQYYC